MVQELFCQTQTDTGFGTLKVEHIHLKYTDEKQEKIRAQSYGIGVINQLALDLKNTKAQNDYCIW